MPSRPPLAVLPALAIALGFALVALSVGGVYAEDDGGHWERNTRPLLLEPEIGPPPVLGLLDHADQGWQVALEPDEPAEAWAPEDLEHAYRWLIEAEPEDLTDDVGRTWHDRLAHDDFRRIVVDVEVLAPTGLVQRGRLVVRPGHRARLVRTRVLRVPAGYDVEIACDNSGGKHPSALGDPKVATLRDGLAIDLRAFLVGRDGRVALECLLQQGRFDEPIPRVATEARYLGTVDLPRYRGLLAVVSGTASADDPLSFDVDGPSGVLRVRMTPCVRDPFPRLRKDSPVGQLDVGFLTAPGWHMVLPPANPNFPSSAQVCPILLWREPAFPSWVLRDVIDSFVPTPNVLLRGDGSLWVTPKTAALEPARAVLEGMQEAVARTVRVEVRLAVGDEIVSCIEAPALVGRTTFLRLGREQAIIPDVDVEVG